MPIVRKATPTEVAEMKAQQPETELGRLNLEIKELEQKLEDLKRKRDRLLIKQSSTAFVELPDRREERLRVPYPVAADYIIFGLGLLWAERISSAGRKTFVFGIREKNLAQSCRANFGLMWREQKISVRGRGYEQPILGDLVDNADSPLYAAFRFIVEQYNLYRRGQDVHKVQIRTQDLGDFTKVWSNINSDWDRFLKNADQHGWNIIKR